jgi:hypothetical protein
MKQNSDLITENISSKDIGQLPDITIAEELNTLPGVNATRDRGNDSQVNVRGLGPRLVLGLVNGEEIASSEPDQDIRWEIFPSEIVSGVTGIQDAVCGHHFGRHRRRREHPNARAAGLYRTVVHVFRMGPTYNDEANSLPDYSPWGIRPAAPGSTSHQQFRGRDRRQASSARRAAIRRSRAGVTTSPTATIGGADPRPVRMFFDQSTCTTAFPRPCRGARRRKSRKFSRIARA